MAKITMFVYCEDTKMEMTPSGPKGVIVAPLTTLMPQFMPGSLSFSVSVGIQGLSQHEEHKLTYTLSLKDEAVPIINSGDLTFKVQSTPDTQNVPEIYQGIIFNLEFKNVVFRTNGEYISRVYVGGSLMGEFPINVYGKESL